MKITIYTAIYGETDLLREIPPQIIPEEWDTEAICFTDCAARQVAKQWEFREVAPMFDSPLMSAKYFKMHPHILFPDSDVTMWIDGNGSFTHSQSLFNLLINIDAQNLVLFLHMERQCIYREIGFSVDIPKYNSVSLLKQGLHYYDEGMPKDFGLFCGGLILSRPNNCREFFEEWWKENVSRSYQDQISLAYLIWKMKLSLGIFPFNIFDNKYVHFDFRYLGRIKI